ncbi:MAG: hypothetical protein PHG63_00575 [Candidatus Dojkabacteria bacterium]|nr:hypothetical protein [Candidatus Dojkabacteria bacterium]
MPRTQVNAKKMVKALIGIFLLLSLLAPLCVLFGASSKVVSPQSYLSSGDADHETIFTEVVLRDCFSTVNETSITFTCGPVSLSFDKEDTGENGRVYLDESLYLDSEHSYPGNIRYSRIHVSTSVRDNESEVISVEGVADGWLMFTDE